MSTSRSNTTTRTSTKTNPMMSTFAAKLAVFLAGFSAVVTASPTSLVADADLMSHLGHTDLAEEHFATFAECVSSVNAPYRAYQEDGTLVLFPSTNRTVDFKIEDAEIWQCVMSSSTTISLAMESALYPKEAREGSKIVTDIRYIDAVEMGVTGLTIVARKPGRRSAQESASKARQLQKKALGYYEVESDDGKTCQGDYNHYYLNRCYNFVNSFESVRGGNPDCCNGINWTIWPHHSCTNDHSSSNDDKTFYISQGYTLPCQVRRTYSWLGQNI